VEAVQQPMSKSKKKLPVTGRDANILKIIGGATKAYVEKDQKKEINKKTARLKIATFWEEKETSDWAGTENNKIKCKMCGFPYGKDYSRDENEVAAMECGYCSVSCMDYHPSSGE
jgi:ABC-type xylose transport system substrate-binding protein